MIYQEIVDRTHQNMDLQYMRRKLLNSSNIREKGDNFMTVFSRALSFLEMLVVSREFKSFVIRPEQIRAFCGMKLTRDDLNSFSNMKMPYEKIFLDFDGSMDFPELPGIKGLFISRMYPKDCGCKCHNVHKLTEYKQTCEFCSCSELDNTIKGVLTTIAVTSEHFNVIKNNVKSGLNSDFKILSNELLNGIPIMTTAIKSFYNEIDTQDFLDKAKDSVFIKIILGFILFINSVNVETEIVDGVQLQTKKRRQQGKPIPESYYLCKVIKNVIKHSNKVSSEKREPSFQYDVRGHFSHYRNTFHGRPVSEFKQYNKETGSIVLWVPPHRRGLSSDVYRPKIYSV